jgi:hypothetical protein
VSVKTRWLLTRSETQLIGVLLLFQLRRHFDQSRVLESKKHSDLLLCALAKGPAMSFANNVRASPLPMALPRPENSREPGAFCKHYSAFKTEVAFK